MLQTTDEASGPLVWSRTLCVGGPVMRSEWNWRCVCCRWPVIHYDVLLSWQPHPTSDEDDTCSRLYPPVNTITSHIQLSIITAGTCSTVNSFTLLAPCEALTFQLEHCTVTTLLMTHVKIPLVHQSLPPNQHLDRFSRFCRAHEHNQQTDRQTERPHATPSVAMVATSYCCDES